MVKKGTLNFIIILTLLFSYCKNNESLKKENFISIEGKKFYLNNNEFYPVALNYIASLKMDAKDFWVGPYSGYGNKDVADYREIGLKRLKADFQMIKDIGFNSVRLLDIGFCEVNETDVYIKANLAFKDSIVVLKGENLEKYFNAFSEMFGILNEVGLKAIVLIRCLPDKNELVEEHLKKLFTRFRDEQAILAWDFFNEPLYFDKKERNKEEVYEIVKDWKKFARTHAPNHLLTIGLTGTREVFEWDPNILDVDFLSIHPYEFHNREAENEIYWYGKYVTKPWIIGETGFSADGDSIGYDVQKAFAKKILQRTVNCGASGFSWWQYKDVEWFNFQSNYLGLLNQSGMTPTSDSSLIVTGTKKPSVDEILAFNPNNITGECDCLSNYYNYDSHSQFCISGRLLNKKTGQPVVGGVVVGWNQWYSNSTVTFTKEDGTFDLYANFKFYHFIISATLMSYIRKDFDWDNVMVMRDSVSIYEIGEFKIIPIEFRD